MSRFGLYLTIILFSSFFLKFWQLSTYPQSLSMDEVGFGYNAYSVLKTGKDEYGQHMPLAFKSLGDFKPPVNVYLTSVSEFLFGFNEFAIRLPSALSGALTVLIAVLFLREIGFKKSSSLFAGFWLSVSAWHIYLSRGGYEVVTSVFLIFLGLYSFYRALRVKSAIFFAIALVSLCLAMWTYTAQRLYVPLLVVYLTLEKRTELAIYIKGNKREIVIFVVLGLLFLGPLLYLTLFSNQITARANDLWLTKDPSYAGNFFLVWSKQYFSYFKPWFLFWNAGFFAPPNYQSLGIFYFFDFGIFFLAIYFLLTKKWDVKTKLMLYLILIGIFPASLTRGEPSPIRVLLTLPGILILLAHVYENLKPKYTKILIAIYFFFSIWGLAYFRDNYIHQFPKYYGDLWHYGYKEASLYACEHINDYDKIIITDKYGHEAPRIKTVPVLYVLVHCQWDPEKYLLEKSTRNIFFREPQWVEDAWEPNALLIGSPWNFPPNITEDLIVKSINFRDNKPALFLVETKNIIKTEAGISKYW